ncbi:hypothetical protein FA13DRAFT_1784952 [Coprinellus micaceus]|uniref:Uncharacterized protein n=1 Tax=Coprinellus micaceus TaxID=71717 RepID=A0A4Y7TWU4_COPMI|nr:hypothetical protein FA13DRAFT_1784952 [Coprinellus micaceus]
MVTLLHLPSSSPLLHTSLAHLTPELIAVEGIIECPGRRPRLPTELMLIVRTHLIIALSACLAEESNDTLAAYSCSLIALLCSDCTSYNTDIYGGNVFDWPWDQFSGPCLCEGDIDDCIARTQTFTDHITKLQCDPASAPYLFRHMELSASRRDRTNAEEDETNFHKRIAAIQSAASRSPILS